MREGAAHIVSLAAASFDELLELGNDFIIASHTRIVDSEAVVINFAMKMQLKQQKVRKNYKDKMKRFSAFLNGWIVHHKSHSN